MYLFLAVLGLHWYKGFSYTCSKGRLLSCGAWASQCGGFACKARAVEHTGVRLYRTGAVIAVHRLSCSAARGSLLVVVHMMYSAQKLNKQGDSIQPWHTPFPIWNQSIVPCPIPTVVSWPKYRFLRRQVRWSHIPPLRIFQFVVINTVKGFSIVNEAEVDVSWNSFAFSMIQWMLAIWSLVLLLFVSPACTSRSSQFTYCWSLVWRIFEHYLASLWNEHNYTLVWTFFGIALFWGLEWKRAFPSPVATAEFSKFAGILSAALSQHYLLEL